MIDAWIQETAQRRHRDLLAGAERHRLGLLAARRTMWGCLRRRTKLDGRGPEPRRDLHAVTR